MPPYMYRERRRQNWLHTCPSRVRRRLTWRGHCKWEGINKCLLPVQWTDIPGWNQTTSRLYTDAKGREEGSWVAREHHRIRGWTFMRKTQVVLQCLLSGSCVMQAIPFNCVRLFLLLRNENDIVQFVVFWWNISVIIHVQHLAQCPTYSKWAVNHCHYQK